MKENTKVLKWQYINTKMSNVSPGFQHEIEGKKS